MGILSFSGAIGRGLAAAVVVLGVSATGASAQFRGGGALFGFTPECAPTGWQPQSVVPALARYVDVDGQVPARQTSEISIALPSGTFNYALWMTPFGEWGATDFRGGTGRFIFSNFVFSTVQPRLRVVHRRIVSRVNPAGPDTLQNARSVVVRVRIQNFSGVSGCAATFAAAMRRM